MNGSSVCGCGSASCGSLSRGGASCCEGNDLLVPEAIDNAPGQSSLRYRVGTWATFFETMLARLVTSPEQSHACAPDPNEGPDPLGLEDDGSSRWPLRELTTRDTDDPTIALLDAWAMVGDVLTFYQERIVNEGYLRTATELRSVEELARLVGYRPRPGVAASVDVAFTLDVGQTTEIPAGTRAQSLPQPGKLPQTYETSEPLLAKAEWNAMPPLQAEYWSPQVVFVEAERPRLQVYFEGLSTNLKINDMVLVRLSEDPPTVDNLFRVEQIDLLTDVQITRALLRLHSSSGDYDKYTESYKENDDSGVLEIVKSFDESWNPPVPPDGESEDEELRFGGTPPNLSGDEEGYNTKLFSDPMAVRSVMVELGYYVEIIDAPLVGNAAVLDFQRDWNHVIRGIDDGEVTLPLDTPQPTWFEQLRGRLDVDGTAGTNTLNALEIASVSLAQNPPSWAELVSLTGGDEELRFDGNPPNTSGDEEGYNIEVFPDPAAVRQAMVTLGYDIEVNQEPLENNAAVVEFQRDWNRVVQGIDDGEVNLPVNVPQPTLLEQLRGRLDVDGTAGGNTLNALEIAVANLEHNLVSWESLKNPEAQLDADIGEEPGEKPMLESPKLFRAWSDRDVLELVRGDRVLRDSFRKALEELKERRDSLTEVQVFRAMSPLFGHNAAPKKLTPEGIEIDWPPPGDERDDRLFLDVASERVRPGDFIVIDPGDLMKVVADAVAAAIEARPQQAASFSDLLAAAQAASGSPEALSEAVQGIREMLQEVGLYDLVDKLPRTFFQPMDVYEVEEARIHSRSAYGLTKSTLELTLDRDWANFPPLLENNEPTGADLEPLRQVMTYIEPEQLRVARTPLDTLTGSVLDLEGLFFDLEPGRVLIVEGDDANVPGSHHAERAIISSVAHDLVDVSTHVVLTDELEHAYARQTTIIHGNVAEATQGESRTEVLGSGDASEPSQEFTLRHKPLTHVPAATPTGIASTLTVRVGGVAWPEAPIRALLGPRDRKVTTYTDEQGRTVVVGGDGWHGARFPTGIENITAEYRSGQGADGNVDPGKITNLATRPFGVQKVTNPIAASGGAGPDDIEETRMRVPLAVMSLDRLLSVEDHQNFALNFAGIAKASSRLVSSQGVYAQKRVQTVVAGNEPKPLQPDSELLERLREAMNRFGDPALSVEVVPAKLESLSITAKVQVSPGYVFREVAPRLRAALTEQLGYDAQGIGQAIPPSRIAAIMHGVVGVEFVDIDEIQALGIVDDEPLIFEPDELILPNPDTVLFVDAARPETLNLTEWKP